jgi:hypothetical protein
VIQVGKRRTEYGALVGKIQGKKELGKRRSRWEDNIRMQSQKSGWKGVDWINLSQDTDKWRDLVNAVMNLRFP